MPKKKSAPPISIPPPKEPAGGAPCNLPVVGIGASAGGLEALRALLRALPHETGMAFVIVQHLAPDHASSLTEILARSTRMPVCEVRDEPAVEPNHVYVIPPGRDMIISGGKLLLLPQERNAVRRGIDQFFRSLAEDSGHQAIGVVLSGSASDGTLGLEVIKAEGGVTFAQDASAQHDSMPKSAVASGCVDFVLSPEGIAVEIARIARHPYIAGTEEEEEEESRDGEPGHGRIAEIVRRATGVDFTHYKANTMQRRIQRRMMVHKIETLAEYEDHLQTTPGEVEALYQDVLINVTSFFRDADAFEVLAKKIFPKVLADRTRHDPVRIWTLGCSTGEEAYSLAILFAECAEEANSTAPLQMFASDLNAACIEKARMGRYPRSIAADVTPERLLKFFTEEDGHYRVSKSIRERVVFSRHNVLADPPFSRVDFISCRNLLIYLEPVLQQKVMPLLHYALKPGGHLWLGSSESLGNSRALFETEDARQKIFARKAGPTPPGAGFRPAQSMTPFPPSSQGPRETPATQLHRDAERVLLAKYAPPGVVVNASLEVVQFRGDTGAYLAPAPGIASHGLLKMLREGLLVPVRTALARVELEGCAVREEGARVKCSDGHCELAIEVIPLKANAGREAGLVILFDERPPPPGTPRPKSRIRKAAPEDEGENARLTQELAVTREYLQSVIEEQDAVNEELQSANEEAQSANEEMQSVNEELETSKEEIQSSNEELATVNDELNNRNGELNRINNDLTNVLASTQLSIVIVARDLRLRRFTPMAEKVLNLSGGDVGRPLSDIKLSLTIPDLVPLLREVIDALSPREREVQDARGRWFSLRARPYLTHDNKVDGAVVTLVDVDTLRRARDYAQSIVANVPGPFLVLDAALRVKSASRAFYGHFHVAPGQTEGHRLYDLGNRQWDIPALRTLLEEVLPQEHEVVDYEVRHTFAAIGPRTMLLNARRLAQAPDEEPLILLSIDDITAREAAAAALHHSELRFRTAVSTVSSLIWTNNAGGKMEGEQPGWGNFTGQTQEEYQGCGWAQAVHPEDAQPTIDAWNQAVAEKRMFVFEHRVRRADGEWRLCSIRAVPVLGDDGAILEWVGVHTDITERHRSQETLRASEERLRAFVTASSDVVFRMSADWSEMGPLDGRNFIPDSAGPSRTWLEDNIFPDDRPQVLAAIREAIRTKTIFALEHRVRRADGTAGWTVSKAVPLFDTRSEITGWFGSASDVTERHEAEAALRASEARKEAILSSALDAIITMDHAGRLVEFNPAAERIFGHTRESVLGRPLADVIIPERLRESHNRGLQHYLATGIGPVLHKQIELPALRADGTEFSAELAIIAIPGIAPPVFTAFLRDVTARKELEASLHARAGELAQADRSKNEFLAMLAHELRNPLAPLRNAAGILETPGASGDEHAQAHRIVGRSIENMSRMIEDLLDVSRITEGKIELRREQVNLEAILTGAASLVRSGCAARRQELTVTLPHEPVYIHADATRLEQVFGNLLGNACKYSGNDTHILLTAERSPGSGPPEVIIRVSDDGAGIAAELLPRIFDLFVQASHTLDRSHGGLGIGLTIVQRLVKLHGGSIAAHSEGAGKGAEFIVRLPILAEAPPAPAPTPLPAQETPRRILIVDDNTDSARSLAVLQSRRGHVTHTAFTGPDAVTAAAEFLPEVVLLDIGLPGMDGFAVARRLRAMPALEGVLIIAMSGYGRTEDRAEARAAGFDEYIVKPVDLEQLREWLAVSQPLPR